MKIQQRIFLIFLFFSIIPLGLIATVFYVHNQELLNRRVLEDVQSTVAAQRKEIETVIRNTMAQTQIIGDASSLQLYLQAKNSGGADPITGASTGFWAQEFKNLLLHISKFFPDFYKLRFIDAKGNEIFYLIADSPQKKYFRPLNPKDNKSKRYFFIEGMKKKDDEIYISPLDLEFDYGKMEVPYNPVIRVETPVFDDHLKTKEGLIIITLRMQHLLTALKKPMVGQNIMFNEQGYYLNNPDRRKDYAFQLGSGFNVIKDSPGLLQVVTKNKSLEGQYFDKPRGQWYVWNKFYYNPQDLKHYWIIASVVKEEEINALSNGFKVFFMVFLVGFTCILVFIISRIVKYITGPIIKLTGFVNKISNENMDAKPDPSLLKDSGEVGSLSRGINNMLERLKYSTASIEELTEANLKAKEAEERFRMIVEGVKDYAIFLLDGEGRVVTWNLGAEQFKGYKAQEIIGQHFSVFYLPEDIAKGKPAFELEMARTHGVYEEEGKRVRKNGEVFWAHVLITALKDKEGRLRGFSKITRDITEEKRIKEEIARLNAFQKAMLDSAGSAVISVTTEGIITSFNLAAEKMLGYSADEMVGKKTPEVFHDKDEIIRRAKEFSLELGEEVLPGFDTFIIKARKNLPNIHEWTYVRRDGHKFPALLTVTALRDSDNRIYGYIGIATDITQYKHIEKELENQQKALNESCAVSITDTQGTMIYVNDKFCHLAKYTREEMLGCDHRIINSGHHPKEFFQELWKTVAQGKIFRGEVKNKAKDGSFFWNDTTIVPFCDENGKPYQYVTIRIDITQSVMAKEAIAYKNEELEYANKAALAAAEAKSNFLANMSHEIRTPMNAILGFSNLLGKTALSSKQKEYLDLVSNSGQLLLGIINDILDISKLESGKINFESIHCDLRMMVFEVMKMIVTRMKNKPFDTYVDFKEDVPLYVKTDPLRLKQVLINLLGNAMKFTSQGEIGVVVEILKETQETYEIQFTVKDTGIGIPLESQKKLFQSFTQADNSTTREYGGTGLGLAISKSIVEALGGKIWLESAPGKGSSFFFTICVRKSKRTKDDQDVQRIERFKDKTVFIVDDNLMSQKIIAKCCETLGLKLMGFSASPHEAFHKLKTLYETKEIIPDIILSDIMMEGMSGLEMVQKIKADEKFKNTTFIAITADMNAETQYDPNRNIFNAYLIKPVSFEGLINTLQSLTHQNVTGKVELTDKPCKGIKVLVAEDVLANQILIEEYFEQLGCSAHIVNNGLEAVNRLRQKHDFDLCLMDIQMPIMDGLTAIKVIRSEISEDFPVIALTASVMREDQERCVQAGMSDFLMKPVDFDILKAKILQYGKKGLEP